MSKMEMQTFYKIGMACFLIIAISQMMGLITTFRSLTIWGGIGSIASMIFNFVLFLVFKTLAYPRDSGSSMSNEDIEKAFKEAKA